MVIARILFELRIAKSLMGEVRYMIDLRGEYYGVWLSWENPSMHMVDNF